MRLFLKLFFAILITSCATPQSLSRKPKPPYQFVEANGSPFDYTYEKFYLSAPPDLDRTSRQEAQAACEGQAIHYVLAKSEGYKVIKSFGTSDEEQITQGTLACLYKAGWKIYETRDGKMTSVNDQEIFSRFMGGRKKQ
jgi:hypothetical protein